MVFPPFFPNGRTSFTGVQVATEAGPHAASGNETSTAAKGIRAKSVGVVPNGIF